MISDYRDVWDTSIAYGLPRTAHHRGTFDG
jgi:hypothetical protein